MKQSSGQRAADSTDWDTISNMAEQVPAIEDRCIMLGFMSEDSAVRKLQSSRTVGHPVDPLNDTDPVDDSRDLDAECADLWADAHESIGDPPAEFESSEVDLIDLPDEDGIEEHIEAFLANEHTKASLDRRPEDAWQIKLVPIENLVAYQPQVTKTAYADTVTTGSEHFVDLLEITLPTETNPLVEEQRIRDEYFKGWQFVSRSPNLHITGPKHSRPDNDRVFARLTFELKTDPNFVYVAHFDDRYILKNGYHRTYQLMRAGASHVPAVVLDTDSFDETGAASGYFDRDLVMSDRPPMLPDYESDVSVDIKRRAKNRVLRIIAEKTDILR